MNHKTITLLLALVFSLALYWGLDLALPLRTGLSILTFIALLWLTETFHITITALLVPVLAVLGGIFSVAEALLNFANPIIFLFLGGFALAAALHEQGLDQRIAAMVLRLAKGRMTIAALLIFAATAFVSMWISNTATAAMMLPLALGLLTKQPYQQHRNNYWFLLLGIAYSANIGGIGTLVGSPPNAIAAAAANLSFADWLSFGIPTVAVMFPIVLAVLWLVFRPDLSYRFETVNCEQPLTLQQWLTLGVFLLTVLLWLLSRPLSGWFGIDSGFDTLVAILAIVLIAALRLAEWKAIQSSADWGVLLLFGGGLTLSALLQVTGTSVFLAQTIIGLLEGVSPIVFFLAVTAFVILLTEIASNTASSALLIPIFISIAEAMGLSPVVMAVMIAVTASCAFMLPVATPPNAIVFGSGYVPQRQMVRAGALLNLCMTLLIASTVSLMIR